MSKPGKENFNEFILSLLKYAACFIFLLLTLPGLFMRYYLPFRVQGPSMEPTLSAGHILIVQKNATLKRGDIVVIDTGDLDGMGESLIVKRVIAMEGDAISCKNGCVYLNGTELIEDYVSSENQDFDTVIIPKDQIWVMGDNRSYSMDSRYVGSIPISAVIGKEIWYGE